MLDAPEWRRREIALLNTLGVCLMPMKGFGNPEVAEVFSAAASISEQEQDKRGLFVALRGKGQYQMISGDLKSAREQTGHILELAEDLDDPGIHIEANHLGWNTLIGTGDYATACRHAEKGIALYDRERDHHLTYIYSGHDPGVCARSFNGVALRQLGYPDQARARCRDGEALAQEMSHPFSIAVAYLGTSTLYSLFREMDATLEASELAVAQSSEHGFAWTKALGRIFRGGARAELGNTEEGIAEMYEGIADVRTTGAEYQLPMHYSRLGELCVKVGRLDDAEQALKVGQALSDKNEDRFSHSEYYRIKGVLLLARSAKNIAQTEAHFKKAIRIAQAQDAKLLQLRATVCLARLWGESSKRSQAHDLLLPVFDWFTEGLDMTDLKDAKALLDDLA
jgi:predicted ATPase